MLFRSVIIMSCSGAILRSSLALAEVSSTSPNITKAAMESSSDTGQIGRTLFSPATSSVYVFCIKSTAPFFVMYLFFDRIKCGRIYRVLPIASPHGILLFGFLRQSDSRRELCVTAVLRDVLRQVII